MKQKPWSNPKFHEELKFKSALNTYSTEHWKIGKVLFIRQKRPNASSSTIAQALASLKKQVFSHLLTF